jgi:hypothetical protein
VQSASCGAGMTDNLRPTRLFGAYVRVTIVISYLELLRNQRVSALKRCGTLVKHSENL